MARLHVIFWWDTEDYINPESDDALLLLLKEFRKRSIPAVFKMVGEKTRALLERGRTDIIDLLKDELFEIGYHTDAHSAHPTIAEYTEHLGWQDGVGEILLRETPGLDVTRETFGKEIICYGQPGASYTPFAYGAMRAWGVPAYLGSSVYLGDDVYPTRLHGFFNIGGLWGASASFTARTGDDAANTARERVTALLANLPQGVLISHGNHPNEWSLEQWWDTVNFTQGAAPLRSDWQPAPLVPPDVMAHRAALYGDYLDWIVDQGVEPVGVRSAMALFDAGCSLVERSVITKLASTWAKGTIDGHLDETAGISLSAAQALYLLAQAAIDTSAEALPVPEVDAPVYLEGLSVDGGMQLSGEAIKQAGRYLLNHVDASGMLPSVIEAPGGGSIPPAVLGVALARYISNSDGGVVDVKPGETRFAPQEKVKLYGENIGPWPIHHDGFTGENLHRYTCLLSWSYRRLLVRG